MAGSRSTPATVAGGRNTDIDCATRDQRLTLIRWLDLQNTWATVQKAKRQMRDLLALRPGQSVLEVGCGTGDDALAMAKQVGPAGRVVGLDLSAFQLEEARRRAAGSPLAFDFARGDVQSLAYAANTFDACRCERVLQHVPEPDRHPGVGAGGQARRARCRR